MNKQVMTKKIRYSIRKSKRYKGAISVGIGCLFLLGYLVLGSSIQADETESIHSVEHTETLTETSADLASDSTVDSVESVNDDKVDANTDALSITDVEETPKEQPIQPMEETSEAVASSTDDSNSNQPETKEGTILTSDYQPEKVITIDEPADYPALPLGNAYHPDKYFIFKSVIDNWSGEVYYFAVNRQQDDGVLFIFDQNGNLRQTQLAGSKKQLDNTVVINYGDTYTISHPYNALSYDYSGDGEKSSVEKNAVYNAITGILPKQSIVTVRYVDENQTDIVAPVQKRALSGESRDIQGPISIEGYVYQYTTGNTKGSVSIYSSEKMNQTWSRHFTYSATNSEIRADYTLLDNQGKFRVDIYRNDLLQKSTTLIPGQYTDYAVYTNGAIDRYRFPNPFIPDSGEVIFHYARVGKIVPVDESNQPIPAAPTPSYHTNPDDPENVLPDEPTPDILGYTKTINTITPVNPTEDTPVVYIRNKEVGTLSVRYIDQDNQNQEITGIGETISGTYGDKIVYSTQPTIESLVKKGYELVHDGFTEGGKELGKDNTGKVYDVIFKHGTQTYTPEHPGVPGTPINPEDPTGSQTPQGTTYQDLVKQASQTIHYTGAGEQTPKDHVTINEKAFTRSVTVDKVTGEIIARSAWQPATVTFETVISPVVSGYQVDKPKAGGLEATVEQPDVVDEVVYVQEGTLSVRYIDQDNQNQEITGTGETISGTYGDKIVYSTQPTIESLVKKGYELVHDGFTEGGKELGKDNTGKVYEVIFKHGTQTYTPEHPGVPGTPINSEDPTGSQTPQGTTYQDLVKQASQTIHYTGAGEQTPKDHVTINGKAFTRSVTVDKVTGEIIARSAWQPATVTFETVISPVVSGYQVDKPNAGGLEATVEQPDVVDEVVYVQEGTLSVRYIDQDNQNQEITDTGETISGTYGDKIVYSTQPTIESLVKKGYELVHDGFTEGGKELGKGNTGKVYEVIFKHGTQTYTPEHPGVPGTPINPEDPTGSQTPQGTTYQDLVKQASQTIHYTGAGEQTPKDHVTINEKAFTRSVTVDKVTGEIIARSAWQPATVTFETVISPVVSGYQVDKPNAGGLEATVEQPDVVDEVNYALKVVVVPTVQKGSVDVSYLDEKGQLLPGTVVELIKNQVPVGETYVVEVKAFTGYTFLKLAEDSAALQGKVENTVKHVRLVYQQLLTPEEESKPQLPNTGGNPQPTEPINEPVTKINKDIPVSQPVTVQPTQSTEKQARMTSRQLPKTGMEGINAAWGFICLALAGLFYKKAKRKND